MKNRLIAIALFAISAAGCKQGLGERCQIDADCASNICSKSDPQVCVSSDDNSQTQIDATVPSPIDAGPDAI